MRVTPAKHFINWQQDPQSNYLARLVFPEKTERFSLEVDVVAEMAVFNPFDFFLEPEAERFPFQYDPQLAHELEPFQLKLPLTPKLKEFVEFVRSKVLGEPHTVRVEGHPITHSHSEHGADVHHDGGVLPASNQLSTTGTGSKDKRCRTIDFLVDVNRRLWERINYVIRMEPGVQTPEETLTKNSGSCRDSAWLLCQVFRYFGLASRFVSGYLVQLTADVKSLDGPSGPTADFTDLHAWCEVYLPGAGWIGLDPTSGLLAGEGHIPLAATPDPQSAAPISGLVDECECTFDVQMKVSRIFESPRVTKPYTEEEWQAIVALGDRVDQALNAKDCRLTMGGEPTFVSIDHVDSPEWNTTAMGPTKRGLADTLIKRLKRQFTTGALLHYGQGKWYPGESLPRWTFAAYWRKDGHPIWQDESLFADDTRDYGHNAEDADRFIRLLSQKLGCGDDYVMPGFEDAWYYMWKERRLPTNVDPFKSNLKNEEDRVRLAKIFEQGLDKTIGYILPLKRAFGGKGLVWTSGPWFFRPERCYLIPGDSPMGFRLPLDSIPWVSDGDFPFLHERDPMESRSPLPPHPHFRMPPTSGVQDWIGVQSQPRMQHLPAGVQGLPSAGRPGMHPLGPRTTEASEAPIDTRFPARGVSAPWIVRTALCVEPRQGRLHIFMPPTESLEDYLELTVCLEETASELSTPIVVEGYPPPSDSRLDVIKVTPDPGVIEVNIHAAHSWSEMVRTTEILYEEARLSRLGTEKFMLDGRHSGTGGGNHIVLGGARPADSPFLRRPDLLRSLTTYWQNHPSLSYLFSGLFIGPTSQSPRVDEARNDVLYELGIAFKQVPEALYTPPWLVDRIFRHLLTDATGNTHRAEFCIDKLYSPDATSGRLGLLEMRAFEMPPHSRMSLTQQLLLRTLIARFWDKPYTQSLVRWGSDIHDRWMLPHFVWSDFKDVMEDLQSHGYDMKAHWFDPHFEFRFPQLGDLDVRNVHLELRHALEPWHVLGEEPGSGGTTRYVDSSVERLQVLAQGLTETRHSICVNGVVLPLHPTGTNGEYVAGLRYRAWQPPSCLHPTIGVHTPLTFDLVDQWNERSLGGCTYHVMHPGGRSYDTFPVNAYEAESRRLSRFFRFGHTPGAFQARRVESDPHFPFTFDLRRT